MQRPWTSDHWHWNREYTDGSVFDGYKMKIQATGYGSLTRGEDDKLLDISSRSLKHVKQNN
jgi:hypothetical protein